MPFAGYYFVKDINSTPCISIKRDEVHKESKKRIEIEKIIVVIKEIESWYVAGLDEKVCNELGIHYLPHTNTLTKEEFNLLIPRDFDSRTDFMIELLKSFSIEIAKTKNTSFKYFCSKLVI